MSTTPPRDILVTGAGSGIGLAIAEHLARLGDRVTGTVRDADRARRLTDDAHHRGLSLRYEPLELSRPGEIEALVERIEARGGIDAVVHNAGFGIFGPAEEIEDEAMLHQFEVNLFGPLRLNRRLLPSLRSRRGRVVWIGSMAGRFALPFQAHYSASKAAMAAFSDAMRLELDAFGVRVTCIEPGDFATPFTEARRDLTPASSPYAPWAGPCLEAAQSQEREGPGPAWVARAVEVVLRQDNPPGRLPVGRWARTLCLLQGWLPDRLTELVMRGMFRLDQPGPAVQHTRT
jgi:NAD(P)-dependent dehydrogenase (short-subunit alcohol dehydrogenase family)